MFMHIFSLLDFIHQLHKATADILNDFRMMCTTCYRIPLGHICRVLIAQLKIALLLFDTGIN